MELIAFNNVLILIQKTAAVSGRWGRRMGRLDVWGVGAQTGSRDRFVDTGYRINTHCCTNTHTSTIPIHTLDLSSGREMTFVL